MFAVRLTAELTLPTRSRHAIITALRYRSEESCCSQPRNGLVSLAMFVCATRAHCFAPDEAPAFYASVLDAGVSFSLQCWCALAFLLSISEK